MNDEKLQQAFGQTPERVKRCIREALNGPKEEFVMKRKISIGLIAALIVLAIAGGVAMAAHYGVLDFLSWTDEDGRQHVNESLQGAVQQLGEIYDGEQMRMEVTDALYDKEGGVFTIAWTIANKAPQEQAYILCEGIRFDGETAFPRSYSYMSEFFLREEPMEGGVTGELPENGGTNVEMTFCVLQPQGEIVEVQMENDEPFDDYCKRLDALISQGKIPVEGDGMIALYKDLFQYDEEMDGLQELSPYVRPLVGSGLFSLEDRFTLSFTLNEDTMAGMLKTYVDDGPYEFDGYTLRVRRAEISPMAARFEVEYITDEKPADGGKGFGPMWELSFSTPQSNADGGRWYTNAGGTWKDPVQLEDGRWQSTFIFEALELTVQPQEVVMTLVTYETGEDGTVTTTEHTQDAVTLQFE